MGAGIEVLGTGVEIPEYIPWRLAMVAIGAAAAVTALGVVAVSLASLAAGSGAWVVDLGVLVAKAHAIWYVPWHAIYVSLGMVLVTAMAKVIIWGARSLVEAADGLPVQDGSGT